MLNAELNTCTPVSLSPFRMPDFAFPLGEAALIAIVITGGAVGALLPGQQGENLAVAAVAS